MAKAKKVFRPSQTTTEESIEMTDTVETKITETQSEVTQPPTQAPTQAPTSAPEVVVKQLVKSVPIADSFPERIRHLKDKGTTAERGLINTLEDYISKMSPGRPVTPDEGSRHQYGLWSALSTIINHNHKEFQTLWNLVLAYFNEYRNGVFADRYVFRFPEAWSKSASDLDTFQRMLNLVSLTSDPKTRTAGLKQVDMHRLLAKGISDQGRQNILRFYGV